MLSVLIITYNGGQHLGPCLSALEVQTLPRHAFEVIVLDNASNDGSEQLVRSRYPWCKYVRSQVNLGFAGGNNLAARYAQGDSLVLLNNDTLPDPHWLAEMARTIERHPGAAVASKLVLMSDPAVLNSTGLFLLRDGRGADRGFRQRDDGRYEVEEPVFAGCAAAVALPAPSKGESIFDPNYFMYCEDLDEAWRAMLRGRETYYAPRAVVRHAVGASAGDSSPLFWFYVERNRALTAVKNGDAFLAIWSSLGLFFRVGRAVMLGILGHPHPKYRRPIVTSVVQAAGSFLLRLPAALVTRYDTLLANPAHKGHGCQYQKPNGPCGPGSPRMSRSTRE